MVADSEDVSSVFVFNTDSTEVWLVDVSDTIDDWIPKFWVSAFSVYRFKAFSLVIFALIVCMEENDPDKLIVFDADIRYEVNEWMTALFVSPLNKVIEEVVVTKESKVDVIKFGFCI